MEKENLTTRKGGKKMKAIKEKWPKKITKKEKDYIKRFRQAFPPSDPKKPPSDATILRMSKRWCGRRSP